MRTLVNSHLTLLAEYGWIAGGAWLTFVVVAICGVGMNWRDARFPMCHRSLWTAFAGLSVSAWMSSVFDWHVLLDWSEMGGLGVTNFTLSCMLLAAYLVMGLRLSWTKRHSCRFVGLSVCAIVAVLLLVPTADVPRVRHGYVVKEGAKMPFVYHDAEWSVKSVLPYLEDGYRIAIEPGVWPPDVSPESIWLFGTCAESACRFTNLPVTVVSPPEFCILPQDVIVVR